jgi:hypothetical protein
MMKSVYLKCGWDDSDVLERNMLLYDFTGIRFLSIFRKRI